MANSDVSRSQEQANVCTGSPWHGNGRHNRGCGGDARDAVKALIVANESLESLVEELKADVSKGYARGYYRGRFKTYTGWVYD